MRVRQIAIGFPILKGSRRRWLVSLVIMLMSLSPAGSEEVNPFESRGPATEATRMPSPKPFSLSAGDAVGAISLLRRVGFLSVIDTEVRPGGTGGRRPPADHYGVRQPESYPVTTVAIREVWAVFLGMDESFPPGHRRRFDLVVNGAPLNWEATYIQYDGRRIHLQQLYTYRNQHPVPWELLPE